MDLTRRPRARSKDLITEELGDQVLVYDELTDHGHCLSPEAARVWRRCDGRTPVEGLSAQVGLDTDTVRRALEELDACDLLEVPTNTDGSTRRELSVKLVRAGGVAAITPLIFSVLAPTAGATQTIDCSGVNECLFDCGSTGHGCKGGSGPSAACSCCQLSKVETDQAPCGAGKCRHSSVKFCEAGPTCPPDTGQCCVDAPPGGCT